MPGEYQFGKRGERCSACGRELAAGEEHYSALLLEAAERAPAHTYLNILDQVFIPMHSLCLETRGSGGARHGTVPARSPGNACICSSVGTR